MAKFQHRASQRRTVISDNDGLISDNFRIRCDPPRNATRCRPERTNAAQCVRANNENRFGRIFISERHRVLVRLAPMECTVATVLSPCPAATRSETTDTETRRCGRALVRLPIVKMCQQAWLRLRGALLRETAYFQPSDWQYRESPCRAGI